MSSASLILIFIPRWREGKEEKKERQRKKEGERAHSKLPPRYCGSNERAKRVGNEKRKENESPSKKRKKSH